MFRGENSSQPYRGNTFTKSLQYQQLLEKKRNIFLGTMANLHVHLVSALEDISGYLIKIAFFFSNWEKIFWKQTKAGRISCTYV